MHVPPSIRPSDHPTRRIAATGRSEEDRGEEASPVGSRVCAPVLCSDRSLRAVSTVMHVGTPPTSGVKPNKVSRAIASVRFFVPFS